MNIRVFEDAERRAMLVNVVDVPPLCNFILPAIIRTGPLAIAISTAGASPALAKRIRDEIAEEYGEPYAKLAVMLNEVRGWAKATLPTYQDRKALLRVDRERRARPGRAAAPGRRAGGARPDRGRPADARAGVIDVGGKAVTDRRAVARAVLRMSPETAAAVERCEVPKGDVLGAARLAGIQAAKRTSELIPLCHPLPLDHVELAAEVDGGEVRLTAEASASAKTGVEMEAMTACAVAALTVYDMVKGVERGVEIAEIVLLEKTGGKEDWRRYGGGRASR